MRTFSHFACIDWSGAKSYWHKGIAVATCETGSSAPTLVASPGRHWTRGAILDWMQQQAAAQTNMLIGLDLSFALPFIDANDYFPGWEDTPPNAKALWRLVDDLSTNDDHLAATNFIRHPEIARHFRQHRSCGDMFGVGRGRLRLCESDGQALMEGINPYSCFNLVGAAQVGKSSLTGMRVLHRLAGTIPVWPFDTLPQNGPVIVEIYTSIAARASGVLPKGKSKIFDGKTLINALARFQSDAPRLVQDEYTDHASDAILTAAWLRKAAANKVLWEPEKLTTKVKQTEGWTFGVV